MFVFMFVFIVSSLSSATYAENIASSQPDKEANYCLLPPYPEHGRYTVSNNPSARPGESYSRVKLDVFCDIGYRNINTPKSLFCVHGDWSATMPPCVMTFCTLKDDPSVEYFCELSGYRKGQCESLLPSGTVVTPKCRSPGYFSLRALNRMNCVDGVWDYTPICKPVSSLSSATYAENIASSQPDKEANYCLLPPYPEHGRYTVSNNPSARPGESYSRVKLDVFCDIGYRNINTPKSLFCVHGDWSATMPPCVMTFCTLKDDPSVEYFCELSGYRKGQCESLLPSGTVVTPKCRSPGYFSLRALNRMNCVDGVWDYTPICKPACGMITQHRKLEGSNSNHAELPWHVVIYMKMFYRDPYFQKCSGSLITATKIISAAHCFWNDDSQLFSASDFVVAVGKLYRPYDDARDKNSQQADVIDIKIPSSFKIGSVESDIAIAIVETPFFFHLSVRPVCLDFDDNLDGTQLTKGNLGKTAGWSIAKNNRQKYEVLTVVDLPYMNFKDCYDKTPNDAKEFLTKDKFCAGPTVRNETSRCYGEEGSGLVFLEPTTQRYYLRGVSSFNINERVCDYFSSYTSILKYYNFIKQYL